MARKVPCAGAQNKKEELAGKQEEKERWGKGGGQEGFLGAIYATASRSKRNITWIANKDSRFQ